MKENDRQVALLLLGKIISSALEESYGEKVPFTLLMNSRDPELGLNHITNLSADGLKLLLETAVSEIGVLH